MARGCERGEGEAPGSFIRPRRRGHKRDPRMGDDALDALMHRRTSDREDDECQGQVRAQPMWAR